MMAAATGIQALEYPTMSRMLATTIGANMMQLSQATDPILAAAGMAGHDTALATGKGFDEDQITKLWDLCGVCNAQQIPPIWAVIQASKGKPLNTYHAHLAEFVESW
jgi:hypothetical protein